MDLIKTGRGITQTIRNMSRLKEIITVFAKNGSDATAAAVRLARAHTGREHVAVSGYHGWQDWYIATTTRDKGVPRFNKELIYVFGYNDIESLKRIFRENRNEIAAVIMEPVDGFISLYSTFSIM